LINNIMSRSVELCISRNRDGGSDIHIGSLCLLGIIKYLLLTSKAHMVLRK
jgi:hypothetical protein